MIRHLSFANLRNFRDAGGYAAYDGRTVKWQRLYRADNLGFLTGADLEAFHALKIRTVIDLRHDFEVDKSGRAPETEGLRYLNLPIEGRRWNAHERYEPGSSIARFFSDRYLECTEDRADNIRLALEAIAEDGPVVVHCAAGKDRTGIVTALALSLAGVSDEDIIADYALTGLATEHFIADHLARTPYVTMWPGFGQAPADAMRFFLAGLAERHGSVAGYCTDVAGLSADAVEKLRISLTEG
ncbi:tyrosine-protein phosphatase [Nonomuraea sp. NPDC050663]|uniref:tyrosine-protein phosphatase n=1 Tax=Nonomuraea sp. NPDC050663 TaxID=3364370 RepID=UPI0037AA03A0